MKGFGKRVGCIHQKTDVVLLAVGSHLGHVHSSGEADAVSQLDVLKVATGGIEVGGARFIEHLGHHAAFGRSAENQYHLSP